MKKIENHAYYEPIEACHKMHCFPRRFRSAYFNNFVKIRRLRLNTNLAITNQDQGYDVNLKRTQNRFKNKKVMTRYHSKGNSIISTSFSAA